LQKSDTEDPRGAISLPGGEGVRQFCWEANVIRFDLLRIPVLIGIRHLSKTEDVVGKETEKLL
jgi:hypothetical protein